MNVVFGLYRADAGRIKVRGEDVTIRGPQHALALGIGMVHQHFTLVENMTVAENVALAPSLLPGRPRLDEVSDRVRELARSLGIDVDPSALVSDLALGERQRVEILKLLHGGAECLILDEPTAILVPAEWAGLRDLLKQLAADGHGVIFISHKLGEVLDVGDRAVVLRKGRVVGETAIADASRERLAAMMVGDTPVRREPEHRESPSTDVALALRDVSVVAGGRRRVSDASLEVHRGEILGLAGVAGNGQVELLEAIVGLREVTGSIRLGTTDLVDHTVRDYRAAGGRIVPEDRREAGLAPGLSVWENLVFDDVGRAPVSRGLWIDRNASRALAEELVREFAVDTPSIDTSVAWLSGGNQQKVVLARELRGDVALLIAMEPTRGLDIGAAGFVRRRLLEQRAAGAAILMLSSELEELVEMADRVAVVADGRIVGTLAKDELSIDRIGLLMTESSVL
jgi:simple sugar transport system ATP-binding protein